MQTAPLPPRETERLAALDHSGALEPGPLLGLDRIAAAAAQAAGTPIALVSFIGAQRQWVRASVGVRMPDVDRDYAFCAWAVYNAQILWVEDALKDPRFCDNPLVEGEPHIRHYAGAPIVTPEGYVLGTVCVIDSQPHGFDPAVGPILARLAAEVSDVLHEAAPVRRREHAP